MKKIYVTGMPGEGKTTIAKELSKRDIHAIDMDSTPGLCSWINKKTGKPEKCKTPDEKFVQNHSWLADVEKLKELMKTEKDTVVVFGIIGNQDEYLNLFDKVILLHSKSDTFIKRVLGRKDNTYGKDPVVRQHMLDVYKDFEIHLLDENARVVNTDHELKQVVEEIIKEIKEYP